MTKRVSSLLLGLSFITFDSACFAQHYGPAPGDWEITLGGSGSNDKNFDSGAFALSGSVGYYINRALEVSVRQAVAFSDFGDSSWDASTRVALDYHFDLKRFRPFIGGNLGGIYGDTVTDSFIGGVGAGLKFYALDFHLRGRRI